VAILGSVHEFRHDPGRRLPDACRGPASVISTTRSIVCGDSGGDQTQDIEIRGISEAAKSSSHSRRSYGQIVFQTAFVPTRWGCGWNNLSTTAQRSLEQLTLAT
jgi:hypothetical protein